jgi:hypothetical protein
MANPKSVPTDEKVVFLEGDEVDVNEEYLRLTEQATLEESVLNLPRGYLSMSQVSMYLRCGLQYAYRYCDDLIRAPGVALVEGSAMHRALEVGLREKKDAGTVAPVNVLMDAWRDYWTENKKDIEDWGDAGKDSEAQVVENRGRLLLQEYHTTHMPVVEPEAVEQRFWTTLGKNRIPVLGFVDLIDVSGYRTVIDHKVVKSAKSQADTDSDMQLTLYSKACGTPNVGFDSFTKTKTPKIVQKRASRTPKDHAWIEGIFDHVAQAIHDGVFLPCDPAGWNCSAKWCGFWNLCRGSKV